METWTGNRGFKYLTSPSRASSFNVCFRVTGGNPNTGATEEWNGSPWTEVAHLNTARNALGGIGSNAEAALGFGGGPGGLAVTESWNGSAWTGGRFKHSERMDCRFRNIYSWTSWWNSTLHWKNRILERISVDKVNDLNLARVIWLEQELKQILQIQVVIVLQIIKKMRNRIMEWSFMVRNI